MTIALVYNSKEEASQPSPRVPGQPTIPSNPVSTPSLSSPHVHADLSTPVNEFRTQVDDEYAEWDTMETVLAIKDALEQRFVVHLVHADEGAYEKLRTLRPDFVFNIAEGEYGVSREAQMPAIFEMLRLPYLGSDPMTLSICLDKARTKEILAYHGIATAPFSVVRSMEQFDDLRVRFPSIVKPLHEGSSKGIYNSCVVRDTEGLEREVKTVLEQYNQPAIVEEFLNGREFTVAIMGNGSSLRVLPIVEIRLDAVPAEMNPIYSYEAKWILDSIDDPLDIYECPARIEGELEQRITDLCRSAYRILGCRDWSRIDVRLDGRGTPHILEINPLPGILPNPDDNSCFPKAARAAGLSYEELINSVVDISLERASIRTDSVKAAEISQ
jgi:D-alanine-D-alanine ligase